jgi:hypothetical protein
MKKLLASCFTLLLSFSALAKTSLRVDEPKLNDVDAAKGSLVKALTEDAARANSGYTVSSDAKAEAVLSPQLHKLDSNYLLIIVFNNKGSSRSERVKLSGLDELDTAIARMTDALLNGKSFSDTASKGEILTRDTKARERVKSVRGFEIAIGTGVPFTKPLGKKEAMWAFGLGFAWDVDEAFMELRYDVLDHFGEEDGTYNTFTLGANYLWQDDGRYSLFSGGNFGFANSSNSKIGSKSGFHFGIDTGALLFRHTDVNLEIRLRYMIMLGEIKGAMPQLGSVVLGLHL